MPHLINGVLVASTTALLGTWATTNIPSHSPVTAKDRVSLQQSFSKASVAFVFAFFFKGFAANNIMSLLTKKNNI